MKVLHVSTSLMPQSAAYRIHRALLKQGIDSFNYVLVNGADNVRDERIVSCSSKAKKMLDKICSTVSNRVINFLRNECKTPFSIAYTSSLDKKLIDNISPDIINLHWICGNFVSIEDMEFLSKYKIVWTLHDSWAFTGGCHIPYQCDKYVKGCKKCEQFLPWYGYDIVNNFFCAKKKLYKSNITIVTPSKWLSKCASQSAIFSNNTIYNIPNPIFTKEYKPICKESARYILNLDANKKYILFGAVNSTSDKNKGFVYVQEALKKLYTEKFSIDEIELLVFGGNKPIHNIDFGYKATYMGYIHDDITLNILYSAADVMLVPSKSENFPNTILEAMSSGTPCVAFGVGGIPDIIEHKDNGYLAKPFDVNDLTDGIKFVLQSISVGSYMSDSARRKIEKFYSDEIIAKKYIKLYDSL